MTCLPFARPRSIGLVTVLLGTLSLCSCATVAAPPTPMSTTAPASAPASRPATTRAASAQTTLRLSSALPVDALQVSGLQVDFASRFEPPQASTVIYFGTTSAPNDDTSATAIIATRVDDVVKALPIQDSRITNAQWLYSGAGPALGELWGVIDDTGDKAAADLVLVHSTDGGLTWVISSLHKPTDQADFTEFQMDHTGHGRLTLYVAADVPDDEPRTPAATARPKRGRVRRPRREPIRAGYYHFRTTDDGKTWTLQPELDAMTPAGDVPEDEQPVGKTLVGKRTQFMRVQPRR